MYVIHEKGRWWHDQDFWLRPKDFEKLRGCRSFGFFGRDQFISRTLQSCFWKIRTRAWRQKIFRNRSRRSGKSFYHPSGSCRRRQENFRSENKGNRSVHRRGRKRIAANQNIFHFWRHRTRRTFRHRSHYSAPRRATSGRRSRGKIGENFWFYGFVFKSPFIFTLRSCSTFKS